MSEPNGYLHIGHAKSICLNFGLAEEYAGVCSALFFARSTLGDDDFNVDTFKPGTSGESLLFKTLESQCNL